MAKTIDTLFAIREKGTMKFLPECWGGGYTNTEPVAGPQPRLLHSERAAKIALTCWLKGVATVHYSYYDGPENVEYVPVKSRSRDKMEIVPVKLVIGDD